METVLLIVHVIVALGLIGFVLLQQGKGADMGAAFGSGASSTVFGASGSANFMSRATAILATLFFVTSLSLAYFSAKGANDKSVTSSVMEAAPAAVPSADMPSAPEQAPASSDLPSVPASEPAAKKGN